MKNITQPQLTPEQQQEIRDNQINAAIKVKHDEILNMIGLEETQNLINRLPSIKCLTERQRDYLLDL